MSIYWFTSALVFKPSDLATSKLTLRANKQQLENKFVLRSAYDSIFVYDNDFTLYSVSL